MEVSVMKASRLAEPLRSLLALQTPDDQPFLNGKQEQMNKLLRTIVRQVSGAMATND
jgi:hypothetical protein